MRINSICSYSWRWSNNLNPGLQYWASDYQQVPDYIQNVQHRLYNATLSSSLQFSFRQFCFHSIITSMMIWASIWWLAHWNRVCVIIGMIVQPNYQKISNKKLLQMLYLTINVNLYERRVSVSLSVSQRSHNRQLDKAKI